jgi:hypothetical protein
MICEELDKNLEFHNLKPKKEIIDDCKKFDEQSTNNSDFPEKNHLKNKNYMISTLKKNILVF